MATRQQRWQQRKIKAGRCARCGKKRDGTNKHYCDACRLKSNVRQREWQREKKGLVKRYRGAESYSVQDNGTPSKDRKKT